MESTTAPSDRTPPADLELTLPPLDASARPQTGPRSRRYLSGMDLSRILRWSGGLVLAAAGITFMFQGLYSFTPMTRHWILLTICTLLGAMGLVTGVAMKESKGARSFLAFTVASFPVLASQLGAMVFSLFGQPPPGMPQPLVFSVLTAGQVAALVALTLAIIIPLTHLGFKVLARPQAARLTLIYTLANLCILLPVREGLLLGGGIAILGTGLYYIDTAILAQDFRLATFEGRLSRGLMVIPLLVIVGRSLFYPVGHAYFALLLVMTGTYLSFHWGRKVINPLGGNLLQLFGNAALAAGWLTWLCPLLDSAALGDGAALYLACLPIAFSIGLHAAISRGRWSSGYLHSAAVMIFLTVLYAHLLDGTLILSAGGLVLGIIGLATGVLTAARIVLLAGGATTLLSLGNYARMALERHASHAWVMLAAVGILVLFSASLAEKGKRRWHRSRPAIWGQLRR